MEQSEYPSSYPGSPLSSSYNHFLVDSLRNMGIIREYLAGSTVQRLSRLDRRKFLGIIPYRRDTLVAVIESEPDFSNGRKGELRIRVIHNSARGVLEDLCNMVIRQYGVGARCVSPLG